MPGMSVSTHCHAAEKDRTCVFPVRRNRADQVAPVILRRRKGQRTDAATARQNAVNALQDAVAVVHTRSTGGADAARGSRLSRLGILLSATKGCSRVQPESCRIWRQSSDRLSRFRCSPPEHGRMPSVVRNSAQVPESDIPGARSRQSVDDLDHDAARAL